MELFQIAGEMGSACVPHAAFGVAPDAPGEEVCNGTFQTATGTVALPKSFQSPIVAPGMNQGTRSGQVLQLLPDFIADEIIIRMQSLEMLFKCGNILIGEFRFTQPADNIQHIQRPATLGDGKAYAPEFRM
jgi:hypothetical protein